jgi:hypothetical protein
VVTNGSANLRDLISNPAVYSAISAFFSAVAAWLLVKIHRANALEAVRPELVFADWSRRTDPNGTEVIRIGKLKNVGKGPALQTMFYTPHLDRVGITTQLISIIPAGDTQEIGWVVVPMQDQATLGHTFKLGLWCFDTKNYRHDTVYEVTIFHEGTPVFAGQMLGVDIYGTRRANRTPFWCFWWIKQKGRVQFRYAKAKEFCKRWFSGS